MAMAMMTSSWTDDRMDDLKHQVDELGRCMDEGFVDLRNEFRAHRMEMDTRFDRLESRLDERFEKVDERFERVDERFEKVDERFERVNDSIARTQEMVIGLHATASRVSLAFVAALMSLVAAQAGLILTQL